MAKTEVFSGAGTTPLTRFPGYLLAQTSRMLRHLMDDSLRDLGLTTPQFAALACIGESEGCTGAEMARIHHLTPQTMNTILHNLEAADFIHREHHPQHGTLLQISLTDEGRDRLDQAMERVEETHRHLVALLDESERTTLVQLLERCMLSMEAGGNVSRGMPCADQL
jgi:DNA-binding MarR family transcriptional regulator